MSGEGMTPEERRRELLRRTLAARGLAAAAPAAPAVPGGSRLPAPLSHAQRRMWFLHRLAPGDPAYHLTVGVRLDGELDAGRLRQAFETAAEPARGAADALPRRTAGRPRAGRRPGGGPCPVRGARPALRRPRRGGTRLVRRAVRPRRRPAAAPAAAPPRTGRAPAVPDHPPHRLRRPVLGDPARRRVRRLPGPAVPPAHPPVRGLRALGGRPAARRRLRTLPRLLAAPARRPRRRRPPARRPAAPGPPARPRGTAPRHGLPGRRRRHQGAGPQRAGIALHGPARRRRPAAAPVRLHRAHPLRHARGPPAPPRIRAGDRQLRQRHGAAGRRGAARHGPRTARTDRTGQGGVHRGVRAPGRALRDRRGGRPPRPGRRHTAAVRRDVLPPVEPAARPRPARRALRRIPARPRHLPLRPRPGRGRRRGRRQRDDRHGHRPHRHVHRLHHPAPRRPVRRPHRGADSRAGRCPGALRTVRAPRGPAAPRRRRPPTTAESGRDLTHVTGNPRRHP